MIGTLQNNLRQIDARRPILAWSGGKDSQLLLFLLREIYGDFPVLVFPQWWNNTDFIARIVGEWDLTAYSYRPNKIDATDEHIVSYYQIGKKMLPVITDVLKSNKCGLERANNVLQGAIPCFEWDAIISGSKAVDNHPLIPKLDLTNTDVITPLWDWTDEQVFNAIDQLDVPIDNRIYSDGQEQYDTGSWSGCMDCQSNKEVYCYKANAMIKGAYYGIV